MPYIYFVIMVPLTLVASVVTTVLLHELGHAIPMLLLSKQPTKLFVGSTGKAERSLAVPLGKLTIHFSYNPLRWYFGSCLPPEDISIAGRILYISTGPLTSIAMVVASWQILRTLQPEGFLQFFMTCVLMYSFYSVLITAIPRKTSSYNADGSSNGNDGHHIYELIRYTLQPSPLKAVQATIISGDYAQAADQLDQLFQKGHHSKTASQLGAYIHYQLKQYERALAFSEVVNTKYRPNDDDRLTLGCIYLELKQYTPAMTNFNAILDYQPRLPSALLAKGYTLGLTGEHDEAIRCLNLAIRFVPGFANAYNNRGFSKIMKGMLEEGLADVQKSLDLDEQNAYAYRNLGLYYLKKQELANALEQFEKASAIDADIPLLADYIQEAKSLSTPTPPPPTTP